MISVIIKLSIIKRPILTISNGIIILELWGIHFGCSLNTFSRLLLHNLATGLYTMCFAFKSPKFHFWPLWLRDCSVVIGELLCEYNIWAGRINYCLIWYKRRNLCSVINKTGRDWSGKNLHLHYYRMLFQKYNQINPPKFQGHLLAFNFWYFQWFYW